MNTLLSSLQLLQIYHGENICIKLNKNLKLYNIIVKLFEKNGIQFQTKTPPFPPKRFDIHFGCEVNFQDLYIFVAILKNFGLQSVFLSYNKSNELFVGSYITESSPLKRDFSQGLTTDEFLKLPFSYEIRELISEKYSSSNFSQYKATDNDDEYFKYDFEDELECKLFQFAGRQYSDDYYLDDYFQNDYYEDQYFAGDIRYDRNENPWIDVFGIGDEAETAYWNTD